MTDDVRILYINNQSLFSNNYLKFRLQKLDLWKTQERKAQNVFENIQAYYYDMIALSPGPGRESELEDKFIRPVLSALGFKYSVEPVTERGYKAKKRPDYALFKDSESLESASADKNNPRKFFSNALTIVEAKYWGRRLNDMDKTDSLDSRDPTAQAVKYLEDVHYHSEGRINWAILTNGKLWRLFYYRASSKSGNFYEVDLEKIITNNDISSFLYFYLFFSKDAFIEDSTTGKSWLDLHLKSSEDYAVRVSEKLKFLIFDKIFETLAEGFLHYRKTELFITVETEESKKKMFKGCLTFLYRLLFLLYAESRNLLPMDNDSYRGVSLSALKGDIVSDISKHGIGGMSKRLFKYWARLEGLFSIISKGEPAMNLPVYNGGLFEVSEDNILKDHRIPDPFIAEVVELLTVDTDDEHSVDSTSFIDYSSLGVRHLGDIYEGLLEFHLQIAGEAVAEAKEKGKSVWKKVSELKSGIKTGKRKETGDAYIENSKHERKTSGSYYTPPYIVEYIVKNTVGQVLDEKFMKAGNLISELSAVKSLIKKQKSTSSIQNYAAEIKRLEDAVFETVFDIRVLDPAIGSGHFLVHTVDFISDRIAAFLSKHPENPVINRIYSLKREIMEEIARQGVRIDENKLTETSLIKRVVLKRCIYGVDLNDMAVELAKLSLWLDSFTSGAPLSFLDHHLKCGNSLIGVMDISSVVLPNSEAFSKVQRALSFMIQVSELTDATVDETQKSKKFFKEADSELAPIRRRFDVHIAKHFMVTGNNISRLERLASTLDFDNEPYPEVVKACKDALLIAKEKRFFHWKLEFPEVFYSNAGELTNPGFDCVIGNPPYINIMFIKDNEIDFFKKTYMVLRRRFDLYTLFSERSLYLLKTLGYHAFIVPNKILSETYASSLRKLFLEKVKINYILDVSELNIFPEAAVKPIVYVIENRAVPENKIEIETPFKDDVSNLKKNQIPQNDFLNIPEFRIRLNWTETIKNIIHKIDKTSFPASRILYVSWGAQPGFVDRFFYEGIEPECENPAGKCEAKHCFSKRGLCKPLVKGSSVERYGIIYENLHIIYDTQALHRPAFPGLFENEKIISSKVTGKKGIVSAYDDSRFYTDDSLVNCILKYHLKDIDSGILRERGIRFSDEQRVENEKNNKVYDRDSIIYEKDFLESKDFSLFFLLSLFNSSLIGFYYLNYVSGELNVFPEHVRTLPVSHISFTTEPEIRSKMLINLTTLYNQRKYKELSEITDNELSSRRNDTIHDLLAYLAKQMVEMNKEKNAEKKGFLKWFEREIKGHIAELTGKSLIRQYNDHKFEEIIEILRKNKIRIKINPSNRKIQNMLEAEFTNSNAIIAPLQTKINETDKLIDSIIYKLYDLTDEEIKIIESS